MEILEIDGCTRTVGEGQGYRGLPIKDEARYCPVADRQVNNMITHWSPTEDELELLRAGCPIELCIQGVNPPPVTVNVCNLYANSPRINLDRKWDKPEEE